MIDYKELIDYFIKEFKKKEKFDIVKIDNGVTLHHFHLKKYSYILSIGYVSFDRRIEIYSAEKLFNDIIIIRSKEDVDEIMEWLDFGGFHYN
ncbi:hypothetical protein [uncultured Fusobacterium sp.]|uniref:hypothetical protein n=1 Tax=uncultured Fusobacterium sp. TaxID=159267 RepID=UPI0025CC6A41|nr:hypothetical protein [uncultured Fusobacterium sp.]